MSGLTATGSCLGMMPIFFAQKDLVGGRPVISGVNRTAVLLLGGSLRLFATPIQRNDLAVLSHSFDRGTAPLIRGSPIGGNMFGASDLGEFFLELVQSPKLFHPFFYRICMDGVCGIVSHLG